ncbi:hypothetical protein HUG20_15715 [Salicibibacter cibi]|uniref:Uncharacterized protein n=1 Tax=Salicibibacter cibi TaxID=2743001 RepID=A0A7T6ZDE1_9BACI|nr:hypothetical protein [Salicibibacter cibi]QQK81207.1 hypothetical protein HUG20_15715 [Salicibibacter cibi]
MGTSPLYQSIDEMRTGFLEGTSDIIQIAGFTASVTGGDLMKGASPIARWPMQAITISDAWGSNESRFARKYSNPSDGGRVALRGTRKAN